MGFDVCKMVKWFFINGIVPYRSNYNTMVLLPKKDRAVNIEEFRPIVKGNFFFKIISKLLAATLSVIVERIISANQFGFIRNRSIHQCIAFALGGVNLLSKKAFGGSVALKLDIQKAFDTINWHFLLWILESFRFSSQFASWISSILSSAHISIMTSSRLQGHFSCSRGVRQGDPLSLILLGIEEDFFSRYLIYMVNHRELEPNHYTNGVSLPTHLLYADDILIFCRASLWNVHNLRATLDLYMSLLG